MSVHIIVPVYRDVEITKACLLSIHHSDLPDDAKWTVIDDCSPEVDMWEMLQGLSVLLGFELFKNTNNLGFVKSVNLGMNRFPDLDVLLVNSDTVVSFSFVQRLSSAACGSDCVGTVTPFSNNATICSYPKPGVINELPDNQDTNSISALFYSVHRNSIVDIPTGVGFCMFINRSCLQEVGMFNEAIFGLGYGEENDFCERAFKLGWRNVIAAGVFVYHHGSISFGDSSVERQASAVARLQSLHPDYLRKINLFIRADPLKIYRHSVDCARLHASSKPLIVIVTHDMGGGVARHIAEFPDSLGNRLNFLLIRHGLGGSIEVSWINTGENFLFYFEESQGPIPLTRFLQQLGVARIHFHHTMGLPDWIWDIPKICEVPYDFTVHDYYSICPRINLIDEKGSYCGEPNPAGCNNCLRFRGPKNINISMWRDTWFRRLSDSDRIFVPSIDVQDRMRKYFPSLNLVLAPHHDSLRARRVAKLNNNSIRTMNIALIGALSPMKGAEILAESAQLAYSRGLSVHFHLIGYAWRNLNAPKSHFTLHGAYEESNLQYIINEIDPHLIWFPHKWPETYGYTLSAALESGYPILSSNIGAHVERLLEFDNAWLGNWDWDASSWLIYIEHIRTQLEIENCTSNSYSIKLNPLFIWNWFRDYIPNDTLRHPPTLNSRSTLKLAKIYSFPRYNLNQKIRIFIYDLAVSFAFKVQTFPGFSGLYSRLPIRIRHLIRKFLRA